VYVYRDTSGQPDDPVAAPGSGGNDAAYWYDLPGTGAGGDVPPHAAEEARGPFEPLVSSADPPGTTPRFSAGPDAAGPDAAGPYAVGPDTAEPAADPDEAPRDDGQEDTVHAHARKLEQIKDLYLTAEAIGEANVDKHFDQLLAQQRELISEYFKQSGEASPAAASGPAAGSAGQAEHDPGAPPDPGPSGGGPAGAPESARVVADQPRAW
jgi:hypothetical protein